MKPIKLSELRWVCEQATPGPWEGDKVSVITSRSLAIGERRRIVAQCFPSEPTRLCKHCGEPIDAPEIMYEQAKANRNFIALARTALPVLLEARRALQRWCEEHGPSAPLVTFDRILQEAGIEADDV